MALYTIKWEIDLEAESAKKAAEEAWSIMKEKYNEATYLDVYEGDFFIKDFDMNKD